MKMRIEITRVESTDDGDYEFQECGTCKAALGCDNDDVYVWGVGMYEDTPDVICVGCAIKELAAKKEELSPGTFFLNSEYVRGTVKECLLEGLGEALFNWGGEECGFHTLDYPKTVNKLHAEFTQKYAKQIEQLGLPRGLR